MSAKQFVFSVLVLAALFLFRVQIVKVIVAVSEPVSHYLSAVWLNAIIPHEHMELEPKTKRYIMVPDATPVSAGVPGAVSGSR